MTIDNPTFEEAKRAMARVGISEAVAKALTGSGKDYVLPDKRLLSLALLQGELNQKLSLRLEGSGPLTKEFGDDIYLLGNFATQQMKSIYDAAERIKNQPTPHSDMLRLR